MAKLPSYIKNKLAEWVNDDDKTEDNTEEKIEKNPKRKKKKEIQPKVIKISLPSFKKKGNSKTDIKRKETPAQNNIEEELEKRPIPKNATKTNTKFNISLEDLKTISTALDYFKKFLLKKGQKTRAKEVEDIDERLYHFIMKMEEVKRQKDK